MTQLERLYQVADDEDIPIVRRALHGTPSITLKRGRKRMIALDRARRETNAEETTFVAHELGHCFTDTFYYTYTPAIEVRRRESRAWRWAIQDLLPYDKFDPCLRKYDGNLWETSEELGISFELLRRACQLYYDVTIS